MPTGTMEETDVLFSSAKLGIKNENKKEESPCCSIMQLEQGQFQGMAFLIGCWGNKIWDSGQGQGQHVLDLAETRNL